MTRFATLVVLVALIVAACTPSTEPASTSPTSSTTSSMATTTTEPPDGFGGEVSIGVTASVRSLNPFEAAQIGMTNLAGLAVWAKVYDIVPGTWDRTPNTVTSLPSQTPGAIEVHGNGTMTVRYEVASGATWSDGTPITGADIAFTAEAMAELAIGGGANVDPVMATVIETDSVDRLAWITFSDPTLIFEDALWVILPAHAIDDGTNLRVDDGYDWPTGGPFVPAEAQQADVVTLERNANYWKTDDQGGQLPYLDRLSIVGSNDPSSLAELLVGSAVDLIVTQQPDELLEEHPEAVEIQTVPVPLVEHLTFQFDESREAVNDGSHNDSREYRSAIAQAIDRASIVQGADLPWSSETPGLLIPGNPSAWSIYPYSVSEGSALIDSLGDDAESDPRAKLTTTGDGEYRPRVGDALVGSFDDIGIRLSTAYVDSLVFFGDQLGSGEFDIGMWAWESNGGFASQLALMRRLDPASTDASSNFGNWGIESSASDASARFSELVDEARTTADAKRFTEIVEEAEQILAENLPLIPLLQRTSTTLLWPDGVSGVVHNGSPSGIVWNIELWQKPGE